MSDYVALDATVTIHMMMRDGETEEQASDRLYDVMYDGLCRLADHEIDFWFENVRAIE